MTNKESPEIWETSFAEYQAIWGFEPARSAVIIKDFFLEKSIKTILIPGIGYGRNAQIFLENGMRVTGIEISKTAIELAREYHGSNTTIYHGSVTDMPFDTQLYEGIFCHALIHLLDSKERKKLIQDCYNQLANNGYMIFTVISKDAKTFGTGKPISKDRYEVFEGIKMFFYDKTSIQKEFGAVGLVDVTEVQEEYPFFLIKCKKP